VGNASVEIWNDELIVSLGYVDHEPLSEIISGVPDSLAWDDVLL